MATPFITDAEATQKIQQSYNQLENQIDGVASGYRGTITIADTPTEDGIYTPTEEGTYTNAGGLIYEPSTTDLGKVVQFIKTGGSWAKNSVEIPNNSVDEEIFLDGFYVSNYGVLQPSASRTYTDFSNITYADKIIVRGFTNGTTVALVAFYDIDKNFISAITTGSLSTVEILSSEFPQNAVFVRCSGAGDGLDRLDFTSLNATSKRIDVLSEEIDSIDLEDLDKVDLIRTKQFLTINDTPENLFTLSESTTNSGSTGRIGFGNVITPSSDKLLNIISFIPASEINNGYVLLEVYNSTDNVILASAEVDRLVWNDSLGSKLRVYVGDINLLNGKIYQIRYRIVGNDVDNERYQRIPASDSEVGLRVMYSKNSEAWGTVANDFNVYMEVLYSEDFNVEDIQIIASNQIISVPEEADLVKTIIPTVDYAIEGVEKNIYLDSLFIPKLGESRENLFINLRGNLGRRYERFLRINPASSNVGNVYATGFDFYKDDSKIQSESIDINVADSNSGTGVTRKLMVLGASKSTHLTPFIKDFFDADVMDVTFVGTLGAAGRKHEARSGWSLAKFNSNGGAFFAFNLEDELDPPQIGDVYSNNSSEFTITEINLSAGTGYVSGERTSGSNNPILTASTLTKVSGNGGTSIPYTSAEINATNPFWNSSTSEFDFAKYMTDTAQSMSAGDWIMIELGTNDCFTKGLDSIDGTITTMRANLQNIIDSIHAYNSAIKIGLVTIPTPAASQDAFAENYGNKYPREIFMQAGWYRWNARLLQDFDQTIVENVHIVNSHLSIDFENNYPTKEIPINEGNVNTMTIQNNALHPSNEGYKQMIQPYVAIIKYFE